jgi:dGTPase
MLSLNTDLIEAIALGHDLGHPPFGHDGEKFLSEVSLKYGLGQFHHNLQSLRVVDSIAKHGNGLNLTFQTRDGILSHNGEVHDQGLSPDPGKKEQNLTDYIASMEAGEIVDMLPFTLEGCVVRLSDTIAYIGQDIEDAIRIGLIERKDIPGDPAEILGVYNGQIIETLVSDVVEVSYGKNLVSFSDKISDALYTLKKFNYERIYKSPRLKVNHARIQRGFEILFSHYLEDLRSNNISSTIFEHFLNGKNDIYSQTTRDELKVRDYIASMTDRYFTLMLEKIIIPEVFDLQIKTG